jgi:hypothetical protein
VPPPGSFDVFRFDKAEARLQAAFGSTQSTGTGAKVVYHPIRPRFDDFFGGGKIGQRKVRSNPQVVLLTVMTTRVAI